MTPKQVTKLIVGAVLIGGAVFLYKYVRRQVDMYSKNTFNFVGINIKSLSFKGIHIVFFFSYDNKMDLNFYVKDQFYEVFINGKKVKTLVNNDRVDLPANQESKIPIDFQATTKEILKAGIPNIDALIYDRSKVKIHIKGYMTVGGSAFTLSKVPVDYEDTLKNMVG